MQYLAKVKDLKHSHVLMSYLFTSIRLGFRNWRETDIPKMIAISGDKDVMEFFPAVATPVQTTVFIDKMRELFEEKGYCYFAVEELETKTLVGFIGLNDIAYQRPFKTTVDVGWRLGKSHWGKGYATEGAKACLKYGFEVLNINEIVATAPVVNVRSIAVMEKVGMVKGGEFMHPRLKDFPHLNPCSYFLIEKDMS
jgi:RimJ/RimL family protein N-acetyltransferase